VDLQLLTILFNSGERWQAPADSSLKIQRLDYSPAGGSLQTENQIIESLRFSTKRACPALKTSI
jgi:hypothetical protein